jgi:hypothetical protein
MFVLINLINQRINLSILINFQISREIRKNSSIKIRYQAFRQFSNLIENQWSRHLPFHVHSKGGNSLWYIKKSNSNQKFFLIPEILSNWKTFYITI